MKLKGSSGDCHPCLSAFALLAVSESKHFYSCSYAVDQGVNFIDTAEAYPVPPKAEIQASPLASLSTAGAISMLCTKRC